MSDGGAIALADALAHNNALAEINLNSQRGLFVFFDNFSLFFLKKNPTLQVAKSVAVAAKRCARRSKSIARRRKSIWQARVLLCDQKKSRLFECKSLLRRQPDWRSRRPSAGRRTGAQRVVGRHRRAA